MRRHPKASAVRSTLDAGSSRARAGRVVATRGASGDVEGSGAPAAGRTRLALLALVVAAFALLALAPLSQAKVVTNGFGTIGTLGGQFAPNSQGLIAPRGIAVNNTGSGGVPAGTTYVVDGNGHRVQRFSPAGVFERAWGQNVAGRDEKQLVAVSNVSGGSFTLTFGADTTSPLAVGLSEKTGDLSQPEASTVESALAALPSIGAGNVSVTSIPNAFIVRFIGTRSGTDVAQLTANASALTGPGAAPSPPAVNITTTEAGSGGNTGGAEICLAANCQDGLNTLTTGNGGVFNNPQGVAVDQSDGHVYVTEQGSRRVQEFDANGAFVRAWGWDVQVGGIVGFEVCTVSTSCKNAAVAGPNTGRFANPIGYPSVDSSGNVWVPDPTNNRIQVFNTNGAFLKMLGGDVVTNGAEGTGNLANGSTSVTSLVSTKRFFEVGQTITAPSGIQPETTINACTPNCLNPTGLTLSKAANAPVTGQTLTVAPGAGNVSANEVQTITVGSGVTGGRFNLSFNGQATGATGTGTLLRGSDVITGVTTATGAFAVGQGITAAGVVARGTTITAVGANTLTISAPHRASGVENTALEAHELSIDSSAATIQAKLEGLSNLNPGDISVSGPNGGPWTVEFQGPRYGGTDVPTMVASSENLLPVPPPGVLTPQGTVDVTSANPFEVCSVAAECRVGAAGNAPGQFSGGGPGDLAFDSAGNLYALDAGGKRVQKFNSSLSSVSNFGAAAFTPLTAGNSAPERLTAAQNGTRLAFSMINVAASNARQILELDTSGALQETSLAGSGLDNISGLAANDTAGTLLATTFSANSPRRVLVLGAPLSDPTLAINPVTTKTDTTASLSGTVDPQGGLVSCSFQYSTDQVTWTDVAVPGCDLLNPGGGAQAVSANATELIPGKQYFVRLSVSRPLVAGSTKASSSQSFQTDGAVPAITNVGAISVEDTSARILATIDPRNSPTDYVIQYGTTPSLGSSTAPVNIGSGFTPQLVSQVISGLSPSTAYYFKVVATNLVGPGSSSIKTFTTRSEPSPLPGGRAYEMVSPANKNGGAALSGFQSAVVAPTGEAVGFCTTSVFGGGQQSYLCADYVSHRSAGGWETKAATPPYCRIDFDDTGGSTAGLLNSQRVHLSLNMDSAVFAQPENSSAGCTLPPLVPGAPLPQKNLYRQSLLGGSAGYQLLAPVPSLGFTGMASQNIGARYLAGDDDLSNIVYLANGQQTPEGPSGPFASGVYEWDEGALRYVPKDPAGTPFTSATVPSDGINGVSSDGERIFFSASSPSEVYMREGGTTSFDVSASECTSSCGSAADDLFQYAAEDGSRALIKSAAKLTDDDTPGGSFDATSQTNADLFLYTHSANPTADSNLRLLSKDNEPADGTNAEVIGIQGISDDATVVYFVAKGQIVVGKSTVPGPKLYRWDLNGGSPTIAYLATLNSAEARENWAFPETAIANRMVTPDGRFVLVGTKVPLDPAADTDTDTDAYRWDEDGGWLCTSCQTPGKASVGNTVLPLFHLGGALEGGLENPRSEQRRVVISDDGQRVFFNSLDALVPGDVNGEGGCPTGITVGYPYGQICQDAYEWHDGTVGLLTTGTSKMPANGMVVGASADGRDVFIFTDERLVGWDTDEAGDIYDARIGGGFPEPPPTGAPCEGEACRGGTSAPPAPSGAGTAAFEGPGNQAGKEAKPRRCPAGKKKVTKNRKTRCVKRGNKKQSAKKRDANNDRRTAR